MKTLPKENIVFNFCSDQEPAIRIDSGEVLIVETLDARCGKMKTDRDVASTEPDFSQPVPKVNPATGPIAVRGVNPGDAVCLTILDIETDNQGFVLAKPNFGIIGDLVRKTEAEFVRIEKGIAYFKQGIAVPIDPMVGVVAVCPAEGTHATAHVGTYGGNLDCREIKTGAKVYLPVFIPEAFVYIGDVHALMGDGEISGTGIEVGGKVTVRIDGIPEAGLKRPHIENDRLYITLGNGPTLYDAMRIAVNNMIDYLLNYGFDRKQAYMFCSAVCDVRLCQACNSPVEIIVRVELKKEYLAARR